MTGIRDSILDYCFWPRHAPGVTCKLPCVCLRSSRLATPTLQWLIGLPEMYQALAILQDQHSGPQARILSLLLMQTATQKPLSLCITNLASRFHQFSIKTPDPTQQVPLGKKFSLAVHYSFPLMEDFLLSWSTSLVLSLMWLVGTGITFPYLYVRHRESEQTNSLHAKAHESWALVNEVEQAWTGVEEKDKAFISKYDLHDQITLLMVGPLLSDTTTESWETCRHTFWHFRSR